MSSLLNGHSINISMSASELITSTAGNTDTHGASVSSINAPVVNNLTDGTGIDKAQKVGRKVYVLSTTPTDIDLSAMAGGINDANINFTKIKEIFLRNLDLVNGITYGGTAGSPANAWVNFINGTALLNIGGLHVFIDHKVGFTVAGANKLLRVVAVAGTPSLEVTFVGEGA